MDKKDLEFLENLTDEACFVQVMREITSPIARRRMSEDMSYCVDRLLKNEKVRHILNKNCYF